MPESYRVLHLITRLIVGGAQENTLLSVEGLDRLADFEVTLATGLDKGPEGDLLTRARRTTDLVIIPELGRSVNPLSDLVALVKVYRLIKTGRYHIVHTHSSKAGVLGRLAARAAGTPIVVHTLHSLVFHDYQPRWLNHLLRLIKRALAPLTHHYISVSRLIAEKAIAAGIGTPARFSTVYSGMELDWYLDARPDPQVVRAGLGIPKDAPVVGKIARLFELKGHDQLFDAIPGVVERFPEARFLLVGDGTLYERLRERARTEGFERNVVFAGLIERERIPEMISAMDVLVHTSLREGIARVLPQAMAMGKPCVSFDLDGAPEVVIPGETGELVRAGDTAGLSGALCRLLADPELRHSLGQGGRRLVDPMYRTETMVDEIADIYRRLLLERADRVRRFDRASTPRLRQRTSPSPPAGENGSKGRAPSWSSSQPVVPSTGRKDRD
jgi:glycosyltransferase involved in cell wall biosynthesis